MKTLRHLALAACAASLIYSCSSGKKDILLTLKLRPNQKIDIKYRTELFAEGKSGAADRTENVRMSARVEKMSADSVYSLLAKFDYVRVLDDKVLGGTEYTSDTDPSQMEAEALKLDQKLTPIIDSVYQFSIDKTGKVVKPFEFASGRAIPAQNALVDIGIFQVAFPAELIGKGSKWSNETTSTGTNYKRTSNYEVESVYDATVQLKVSGTVAAGSETQKFDGRYYLNKENGQLDSCKIEIKGKAKTLISIVSK